MHLRELKHFEKEKEYCMAATEISVDMSTGGKIVAIKLYSAAHKIRPSSN